MEMHEEWTELWPKPGQQARRWRVRGLRLTTEFLLHAGWAVFRGYFLATNWWQNPLTGQEKSLVNQRLSHPFSIISLFIKCVWINSCGRNTNSNRRDCICHPSSFLVPLHCLGYVAIVPFTQWFGRNHAPCSRPGSITIFFVKTFLNHPAPDRDVSHTGSSPTPKTFLFTLYIKFDTYVCRYYRCCYYYY